MTHGEQRQQRAFDGPATKKKAPWLCTFGACENAQAFGTRCVAHHGLPMPSSSPTTRPRSPRHTKHVEPPLKWCTYHQRAESREGFGRDRARTDGLATSCKAGTREYARQRVTP